MIAAIVACSVQSVFSSSIASHYEGLYVKRTLRASDEGFVTALRFNQTLLICNAYPSKSEVGIKKNGKEVVASTSRGLRFNECRYIRSHVQTNDKLDIVVKDNDIHGTFDVGELPSTDAVLLLVLSKQQGSPLLSFQSFAFPVNPESEDAQLAIIDSYKGHASNITNGTVPHLKMQDHVSAKAAHSSRRAEQLNFNRVYAVEAGTYDTSVVQGDRVQTHSKVVQLKKRSNYVIIRTGDSINFPEGLVVFPQNRGGASQISLGLWTILLLATSMFIASTN